MRKLVHAIITTILLYFVAGDAKAEKLSEHNELHAAIKAAQQQLLADGCALAWPTRVKRFFVLREPDGMRITAKEYFIQCAEHSHKLKVSWDAPEAGAEIASYQIYVGTTVETLTEVASVPADQLSTVITVSDPMLYIVMTSTDVNGAKSEYSQVARIEYVPE